MPDRERSLPDLARLEQRLGALLAAGSPAGVSVLERADNVYTSTSATEIVRCRLPDGTERTLFCKYLHRDTATVDGRTIDPGYEVEIYRTLLDPSPLAAPGFRGAWRDASGESAWLVTDYLDRSRRLMHVPADDQAAAMAAAAAWIGAFQADAARRAAADSFSFLERRDAAHYRGRLERMLAVAGAGPAAGPWLDELAGGFDEVVRLLTGAPETVVHGEYYPKNILFRDGRVYPVDWETAALAAGELDLATLTENWPQAIVDRCVRAYRGARYPDGAPADFERVLTAARACVHVHWLGHATDPDRPKWSRSTAGRWRMEELRRLWQRLRASRGEGP